MPEPDDKSSARNPDLAAEVQYRLVEQLAESERRHRELLAELPDVVLQLDADGCISYLNDAWFSHLGYEIESMLGKPVRDFISSSDQSKWDDLVFNAGQSQSGDVDRVVRFLDKEGAQHWMNTRLRRLDSGELVGSLEDVTIRRQLESELLRAQRLESIGRLAGGLAHDFNNLLTVILGNINLAQLRLDGEKIDLKELDLAARACDHASNLTKQMLSFSKGGEPVRRVGSLSAIVTEAVELCMRGSNAQSLLHVEDELPFVEMDASQIHQVINNLVINAIQAMPDGGRLKVDVSQRMFKFAEDSALCDGVTVEIRDEGVGIPPEHREHIFEPYFTTKESGNGLGLTSAFWIVQRHGGLLEVETPDDGKGTIVRVTLPAAEGELSPEGEVDEKGTTGSVGRILVMDDDDLVRDALVAMLEAFDHDVTSSCDGEQCVEIYEQARKSGTPFDLVIMDLTIAGGRDGVWTIRKLRELDPEVRAIVASGYSNAPVFSDPESYGFSGVLPKPLMLADLERVVAEVLAMESPIESNDIPDHASRPRR